MRECPSSVDARLGFLGMESRSEIVASQLRALMERHGLAVPVLSERSGVDAVTIRRILAATAKTEPSRERLRRIAAAVGESPGEAFPDDFTRVIEPARDELADLAAQIPAELRGRAAVRLREMLEDYRAGAAARASSTSLAAREPLPSTMLYEGPVMTPQEREARYERRKAPADIDLPHIPPVPKPEAAPEAKVRRGRGGGRGAPSGR